MPQHSHPPPAKPTLAATIRVYAPANPLSLSDMHIISETKISSGNSTIIPAEIIRSLDINPGDILIRTLDNHEIKVKPRKNMQFKDTVVLIEEGGDSVSAKKEDSARWMNDFC